MGSHTRARSRLSVLTARFAGLTAQVGCPGWALLLWAYGGLDTRMESATKTEHGAWRVPQMSGAVT